MVTARLATGSRGPCVGLGGAAALLVAWAGVGWLVMVLAVRRRRSTSLGELR